MRVPVSENVSFGSNAVANPSVARVEKKMVPLAKRLVRLMVEGSGEPTQRTPVEENEVSRPGLVTATVNCELVVTRAEPSLNERSAKIGSCGGGPNWLALARRFVIRSPTRPEAGTVKLRPLKTTALGAYGTAGTLAGTGPAPVSTVSKTSVVFARSLLVTLTLRKTVRFPLTMAPGVPRVQSSRISPVRSVMPSDRTMGGTAEGV